MNRANLGWYKKRVKPHFILLQQEAENYEGKSSFLKNSQEGCPSCQYTAALEVDVVWLRNSKPAQEQLTQAYC